MRKFFVRLLVVLLVLVLLAAGGAWAALSYIAPDEPLDLAYEPIDVRAKALDMVKSMKPELVLTEADTNNLIKMHLARDIAPDTVVDGASFRLEASRLIAHLNVTYKEWIPAQVKAVYELKWKEPNLLLEPVSLGVKGVDLPLKLLEPIVIALDLPTGDTVKVENVVFANKEIKVRFKLQLPF